MTAFNISKTQSSLWASVPIVLIGLFLATYAIFKAPWPSDPDVGQTVSHRDRMNGKQPIVIIDQEKTMSWHERRLLDRTIYDVLAMGYTCVVLAFWRQDRRIMLILAALGGLGVLYSAFIGLTLGPILAAGGFSLVLFSAGLAWASHRHRPAQTETGLNSHGTHSAA